MIQMDNVVVPEENLLPHVSGLAGPFGCLNRARLWHFLGCDGSGPNSAGMVLANTRWIVSNFGKPLAANQLVQKKLADMQTEISLGLQGSLRLGRLMDQHNAPAELISLMKTQQLWQSTRYCAHCAGYARGATASRMSMASFAM